MQFMLFTFLLTMSSLLLRPSRAFHLRPLIARRSLSIRSSTSTNAATSQEVEDAYSKVKMEDIVSLCKRRGFVYQNSELYNGNSGFYDFGPLGSELKSNIKSQFRTQFIHSRSDIVSLDTAIISSPKVWESSGHVGGFSDPMSDCRESKKRFRSDQLFWGNVEDETGKVVCVVCVHEDDTEVMEKEAKKMAKRIIKNEKLEVSGKTKVDISTFKDLTVATEEDIKTIPSPESLKPTLTMPKDFNLMFSTHIGASSTSSAYLRPETAQGIFINFKNVLSSTRMKVPFGIAQVGKAFRNEITPRNFVFRSREFEQCEVEYFIPPGDCWKEYHQEWLDFSKNFLLSLGVRSDLMDWDVHSGDSLAHYARACTDVTFKFPFGVSELMGIAARGDYDLKAHESGSGKSLEYHDVERNEKYIPNVIEPSLGVDRVFLAIMCSAYAEDEVGGEKRNFLKFDPKVAPVKASILPLLKNKPELVEVAEDLYKQLKVRWNVDFDVSGAIGRRYRRADEIGTPFCITIDFDTIEKEGKTVTVRFRDSCEQVRMPIDEVMGFLGKEIDGY